MVIHVTNYQTISRKSPIISLRHFQIPDFSYRFSKQNSEAAHYKDFPIPQISHTTDSTI